MEVSHLYYRVLNAKRKIIVTHALTGVFPVGRGVLRGQPITDSPDCLVLDCMDQNDEDLPLWLHCHGRISPSNIGQRSEPAVQTS